MDFKFGVYGFDQFTLMNVSGPVLNGPIPFREMKFRSNFVEFSTEGLWEGLDVVNRVAESLIAMYPEKFDPAKTKIWVDGETLDICLLNKVRLAEKAMREAGQLLRQGRSKKPEKSNETARKARLKLERTLKTLQLQ